MSDVCIDTPRFGPPGRQAEARGFDEGYVVVDALIALTIFATTIVFAIVALQVARHGAEAALEARQANELLRGVLEQATVAVGDTERESALFSWRLTVREPVVSAGAMAICEQDAVVTAKASGRSYSLKSGRICPSGAPS